MCLAQQTLKPLTGSPDQKPVQPKKRRLVSASLGLDTTGREWFPLLVAIVRFEYRVCNGTGEVELGCSERS